MALTITHAERLASMEVEVRELKRSFESHKDHTDRQFDELKDKLDELLTLRNKGVGAFWLASSLIGTGIMGLLFQLVNWFKG